MILSKDRWHSAVNRIKHYIGLEKLQQEDAGNDPATPGEEQSKHTNNANEPTQTKYALTEIRQRIFDIFIRIYKKIRAHRVVVSTDGADTPIKETYVGIDRRGQERRHSKKLQIKVVRGTLIGIVRPSIVSSICDISTSSVAFYSYSHMRVGTYLIADLHYKEVNVGKVAGAVTCVNGGVGGNLYRIVMMFDMECMNNIENACSTSKIKRLSCQLSSESIYKSGGHAFRSN